MKKILAILSLSLIVFSCKKESFKEADNTPVNDLEISQKVKIVDLATNNKLIQVDTSTIIFSNATEFTNNLLVGDILVSGIHQNAPEGYLAEIVSITQNSSSQVVINITPADLSQIVVKGGFSKELEIEPDASRSSGFTKTFSEVLYDQDGNHGTTNDQVKVSGSINVKPTLILDAKWSGFFSLDELKMGIKVTQTDDFTLSGNVSIPSSYLFEKEIYRQRLSPIQFSLGPVPVVITPIVVIKAGIDGHGNLTFNVTYDDSHTVTTYVKKPSGVSVYDFSNWNRYFNVNTDYQNFNPNNIPSNMNNIDVDLEIPYVWAGVEFYLYNLSSARSRLFARADLNLNAQCNFTNNCSASLDLNLSTCIDAYLRVFSKTYVDNQFCFGNWSWNIWSYTNNPLVAHYPFDGNANDVSGNNYHGVANYMSTTSDRNGTPGKAYYFNGTQSDVTINHKLLTSANNTVSVWIKPFFNYNDTGQNYLFDATTNGSNRYLLYKNETVGLTAYGNNSFLGSLTATSPSWWKTNQWMHVAIVYNDANNSAKLYVDGQLIHTYSNSWSSGNPSTFYVGRRNQPFAGTDFERFVGNMDDLKIYNKALTAAEILDIYNE